MVMSQKPKFSIYLLIYVASLTYGHEIWVVTEGVGRNEFPLKGGWAQTSKGILE